LWKDEIEKGNIVDGVNLDETDSCNEDMDCIRVHDYRGCCRTRVINRKYMEWYKENAKELQVLGEAETTERTREICSLIRCTIREATPYCNTKKRCDLLVEQTEWEKKNLGPIEETKEEEMIACTMDAKQCPDGSYVGRIPPDCKFKACPE